MATAKNTVKDPVCGMDVKPQSGTPSFIYEGRRFHFCAEGCRKAFEKNPGQFEVEAGTPVETKGPVKRTVTTDPVCKMRVPRKREEMAWTYEETRFYFCGRNCMRAFAEDPDKYLKKKGVIGRFLDRLAQANEKAYGGGGPSCH
jgi:Cu+-exporting ATPase